MLNKMTTAEFAAALHLNPQTIRANLCHHGHVMGIRPFKLPNRRLLWDADELERLISGQAVQDSKSGGKLSGADGESV
jgi:hypothetical protein